jgi:glycosyltransferase involved in cell wall biosynthesis
MNTLLVVPWDEKRGGVISVVANLAEHLRSEGHDVLFFHSGSTTLLQRRTTKLGFPGVQLRLTMPSGPGLRGVLRTLAFPVIFVSTLVQMLWLLWSRGVHIVNLHYPIDNYVYFAICKRLLRFRLVTSIHGSDAFYQNRAKDRYSLAFRFVIRSSDLIVLPSDAYRRKFVLAFPNVSDRTIFIHNGVDLSRFSPGGDRTQAADVRNRFILCVADLQEYKGIDVLLHASTPLLSADPSLTLVLAGDGPLRRELDRLATELGVRHQIMFLGRQGEFEIRRLLHGCALMVLPSRMESFGIALIEAMACRVPVVATNVGGIPEIIEHEISGILIEPENSAALAAALRRVLTDVDLSNRLAESAHRRVRDHFAAARNGAQYSRAFARVLHADQPIRRHGKLTRRPEAERSSVNTNPRVDSIRESPFSEGKADICAVSRE